MALKETGHAFLLTEESVPSDQFSMQTKGLLHQKRSILLQNKRQQERTLSTALE
jgi:hypothetical protein